MILAAGLGTRMRPLTDRIPKALVPWKGKPLLDHVVLKLKEAGFREVIINVHHFAEMIMEHVGRMDSYGIHVAFSHEEEGLLDTGGGIAKAAWFLKDGPFLVYNVDVQCSIDLGNLMQAHTDGGCVATMAVMDRPTTRNLLMDKDHNLKGWRDNRSGESILLDKEEDLTPLAFSAIQVMDPEVFTLFPGEDRFPLMPFYLELARTRKVKLYRHDGDFWMDMGKLESYQAEH